MSENKNRPELQDDKFSKEEIFYLLAMFAVILVGVTGSAYEALEEQYELAFMDASLCLILTQVLRRDINYVVLPLAAGAFFVLRDVVMNVQGIPLDFDFNAIGAIWCVLEAIRRDYENKHNQASQ